MTSNNDRHPVREGAMSSHNEERSAASDRLRKVEIDHEEAVGLYLEAFGWKRTSETPGCVWMWVRDFEGFGQLTQSASDAIRTTRRCLDA